MHGQLKVLPILNPSFVGFMCQYFLPHKGTQCTHYGGFFKFLLKILYLKKIKTTKRDKIKTEINL